MKKVVLYLCLLSCVFVFAQDKTNPEDEDLKEVPFQVIEDVPVITGCEDQKGAKNKKNCMSKVIQMHFAENFNTKIAKRLKLPQGLVKIIVMFKIGKDGQIIDIKVRSSRPKLEKETIRVTKLIPKIIKPGMFRGKPVVVPYSLPINFRIQD